jgi:hypothetical protein
MAKGSPAMPKALIVGALAVLVNACSLLSGDIKESNELGEWVVAKPQTFMYKSYSLNETESLPALTRIVAKKQKYYGECLRGKVRSGYDWAYGKGGTQTTFPIEYTESCSRDYVNRGRHDLTEGRDLTLSEAEAKLEVARRLLGSSNSTKKPSKGLFGEELAKR